MSQRVDFTIDQGATFSSTLTFDNPNGSPIDFTGCTAEMQIREVSGGPAYITLTTANGLQLGGTSGTIAILIPASETALLPVRGLNYPGLPATTTLAYDILVTSAQGYATRYAYGSAIVTQSVTMPGVP